MEISSEAKPFGGDVDYAVHGLNYSAIRQTDPRIAAMVHGALGDARTVLNVGAGAGSYEPLDRYVLAIDPSPTMRAQRSPHQTPAIHGFAEDLPLDGQSVDAAMAMVTIHQWSDLEKGIAELRRVTRGPIVILTFDGDELDRFWLSEYAPDLIQAERRRYPKMDRLRNLLGGATVEAIKIPIDCTDGFTEAFYARPERFLEESVRRSQSAWSFLEPEVEERIVKRLRRDLESGEWERRYGEWRSRPCFEGSLRLVVGRGNA
ncbi:MAG TPA: class I SAM-dependent methyltransferase [Fimbriimonas sp.]|nr:class I SAM-dependent methyltransferase [Fimbriimonas sp.]